MHTLRRISTELYRTVYVTKKLLNLRSVLATLPLPQVVPCPADQHTFISE